jgi:hypothetical protein
MTQQFFDARDLWQTQVPYHEPDRLTSLTVIREIIAPTFWRAYFNLTVDATVVHP